MVDQLFASPTITVSGAAEILDVTFAAAQRNIDKLVQRGILKEMTGQERNRVYVAGQILKQLA